MKDLFVVTYFFMLDIKFLVKYFSDSNDNVEKV